MSASSRKIDSELIALALYYVRMSRGMTQEDVANKLGVTKGTITFFENGFYRTPSPEPRFVKAGKALGKEMVAKLPAAVGCKSIKAMIEEAETVTTARLQDPTNKESMAIALRYLREAHDMTQEYVAGELNISRTKIADFESGALNALNDEKIAKLPGLFGCKSRADMLQKAAAIPWDEVYGHERKEKTAIALAYLREEKGMSQEEVGEIIGAERSSVSAFECGKLSVLNKEKIAQLPGIFGCKSLEEMWQKADALSLEEAKDTHRKEEIMIAARVLREERHMLQKDVALKLGIARNKFSSFERGQWNTLNKARIDMLPGIFGCKSLQEMRGKANAILINQTFVLHPDKPTEAKKWQELIESTTGSRPHTGVRWNEIIPGVPGNKPDRGK